LIESSAHIRFVILGGVQALRHDTELDLGGAQSRSLLAMLLLAAGGPVPTAELVNALWAEDPPNTAVNMVHRTIGGLRRLLEPGLGTRENGQFLIRGSGGVRMQVTERNLDHRHSSWQICGKRFS
jgi:DNA-binding SARP family transcriptional activator